MENEDNDEMTLAEFFEEITNWKTLAFFALVVFLMNAHKVAILLDTVVGLFI